MQEALMGFVTIGSLIAGYFLRDHMQSYMAEKGKNLATKEDISEITRQIESVKFSMQILTQIKTDFEQQRREWLLSFYGSAVELHYEKLHVNFGDLPIDDGRALFEFQQSFQKTVASMVKQYQRIVIYFEHEHPLRIHAEALLVSTLSAESVLRKRFGSIKVAFVQEMAAFKEGDRAKIKEKVEETNVVNKAYWDEMRPIIDAFRSGLEKYLRSLNQFLHEDSTKI